MQPVFQNGNEQINGDGDPDLGAHGVRACAVKGFDAQMLFDPFEEQFDLPAARIKLDNRQGRRGEVVGQKDQFLAGLGIAIADASPCVWIIVLGVESDRYQGLWSKRKPVALSTGRA